MLMRAVIAATLAAALVGLVAGSPVTSAAVRNAGVTFTNVVASTPFTGGGYPVPPGSRVPVAGTCGAGPFNANQSESWIAVKPGTEDLVGSSKFFFDKYSTFYMFYLGSYRILNGAPLDDNQVQGYDCVSTGTQEMPPSWTDTTDPNADFDTQGRVYQTMLPFNSFFGATKLHPDGEIDVSYSDDNGRHWVKGNGGVALEPTNNASAKQAGHVEDKQWIAVNHIPGHPYQDHVYAAWAVFNGSSAGQGIKVRLAVSRDRGQTFDKAVTISPPSQVGPADTFVYPSIDAAGALYVAFVSFPPQGSASTIYVARSADDGVSFSPFVPVTIVNIITTATGGLPNTRFRDGIAESFVASPTYPNHVYLTYEDWNGTQMDVKFTQSTDGGMTWSAPAIVNDAVNSAKTDQFQPSVAAGPAGAVAVAFYDRRAVCPSDKSVRPQDVGRSNFCIDVSVQPYKDSGAGALAVGPNVRASQFTWDPEMPDEVLEPLDGLDQMACASHENPCVRRSFIGDYFGLAISDLNIYALSVSTHYPSSVRSDNGTRIHYQQQVLATI